jgi:hypothetical protein
MAIKIFFLQLRDGILIWLINILFAVLSVITTFAWIGISGLYAKDVVQPNAFIYFVYYNISHSLWAGLAFGLIFLSGVISMVTEKIVCYVVV